MIVEIALMTTTSMMTLVAAVVVLSEATTNSVKIYSPAYSLSLQPNSLSIRIVVNKPWRLSGPSTQLFFVQDCSSRLQKLPATSQDSAVKP